MHVTVTWISNGAEAYLRGEYIAGDTAFRAEDPLPFPVVAGDYIRDLQVGETVFAATGRVNGTILTQIGYNCGIRPKCSRETPRSGMIRWGTGRRNPFAPRRPSGHDGLPW